MGSKLGEFLLRGITMVFLIVPDSLMNGISFKRKSTFIGALIKIQLK